MIHLHSVGLGALVLAREILRQNQTAALTLTLSKKDTGAISPYIEKLLPHAPTGEGVAYLCDHHAVEKYAPILPEKSLIHGVPLFASFAEEGLCDTVEFRRLARKYLRPLRHAHVRQLVLLDPIMCSKTCVKVLQHIAGPRMHIVPITAHLQAAEPTWFERQPQATRQIQIHTEYDIEWTKARAEKILSTKLAASAISAPL